MGSGNSKVGVTNNGGRKPNGKGDQDKRGAQDMARSFVSKVGAIKMILKNEESKQAFITFMEKNPKHATSLEYLKYYFETEEVIRTIPSLVLSKATDLINKYKKLQASSETAKNILISLDRLGENGVNDKTVVPEVLHFFSKSQAEVFGLITPSFEAFTLSDAYKAWRKEEGNNEKIALINRRNSSSPDVAKLPSCKELYPYILVVDDSAVTAKIASITLQRDGHTVEVAKNGADALHLMKTKAFDLVLTDINIPLMDGIEVTKQYRKFENEIFQRNEANHSAVNDGDAIEDFVNNPASGKANFLKTSSKIISSIKNSFKGLGPSPLKRTKPCMIIGMSIVDDEESRNIMKEAGMNGFMQKPFFFNKFLEVVYECHVSLYGSIDQSTKETEAEVKKADDEVAAATADNTAVSNAANDIPAEQPAVTTSIEQTPIAAALPIAAL